MRRISSCGREEAQCFALSDTRERVGGILWENVD